MLATIIAPSPDPCVFEVTEGWHPPYVDASALVTQRRYDLRRLAAVEFLTTRPNLPSAALRTEVVARDDPEVRGVRLRGPGLLCSRRFTLASQPRYSGECSDTLDLWGYDQPQTRRRIEGALATLVAACPIR